MHEFAASGHLDEYLVSCLNSWGISELTDVQNRALAAGIANGKSAVVCAPTSSGKTLIGELALVSALQNGKDALYLVSHKALAEQKFNDLRTRISNLEPLNKGATRPPNPWYHILTADDRR